MTLVGGSGQPGQIVLHLSPDTLGTVRVTLSRDAAGHTTLTFEAGRPETLHALAGEVGQLRHAVNEAGLGEHSPVEVTFRQESIAPVRPVDTDNTLSMSFDDRQQHHAQATEHSAGLNDAFTSSGNNSGGSEHGSFGRPDRTQRDRSRMPGMGEGMSVTWPDRATALAAGSRPVNITV
nr:flagellar hook-length control protein FliK [Endobacter medicaginis]